MNFLTEAFQKLNLVESEEFSLDKKGTDKLKTFLDDDAELDVVTVIDPSEENQADIENVHLGMTILGCEICNQLHYCDPEEVVIDEESQMANVGVCCPYCFGTDGFKIVGTVAPFEDITVEVVDGDKDGIDVKVDGEEVEVEDKKGVNESLPSWIAAKKYQKMKGKEQDVMSKTAKKGASKEEVDKIEKEKKDFQDKMSRNKMAAKAGARAGNKTQQVLDKTATDARNAGAERGRQTIAKNRKEANRTELAKKYFGSDKVDDKQIARMTKELAAAGYSLQEDLGSWIAAKKLAKMKKNGPRDGEDLEARKDKMSRLTMRAKAGAYEGNKTQKVLDDANSEERRRNLQKGPQERHSLSVDNKKKALVTKFGVKDITALDNLLKKSGYVAEALCEAPYLDTQYDSRASFYNKARISDDGNTLYSYETKVMEIKDGKPVLTIGADLLSQTTLRHIKEFLKQKGFPAESKQQILRDYSNKVEEALNESPTVDLSDEEYAELMKRREANKPADKTTSTGTRGANLLTTLRNKKDSQEQIYKLKKDEEASLSKLVQSLQERASEIIHLLDSCCELGILIQKNSVPLDYGWNINGNWWDFATKSGDSYTVKGREYQKFNDDTSRVGIPFCYLSVTGKIWSHWDKDDIDERIQAFKTFLNDFDEFEDMFYSDVEEVLNSSMDESLKERVSKKIVSLRESKESLKNRLNRKSLIEKKLKSTDDLTDSDIFDLLYAKITDNGIKNTKDVSGKRIKPLKNLGAGYSYEDDVRQKDNSQGIPCIFISANTKEELAPAIEVATYYDCLYEIKKMKDYENDKPYGMFIDYGSGDLEKLLADKGKPFAGKKKGEKLQNSQKYPIESPLPAQTGLRKNGKLDLSKTKAGDPNKSDILVEGDKQLKEGMEDISITTEDQVIKVKATPRADKETIVPPVEEFDDSNLAMSDEDVARVNEPFEDPFEEAEEASMDIEDIDEEGFDELGESYLKRVYENVKSFKTVSGQTGKNKIILEGIITFKSGKKAKTSFILEAKEMTKRGKVRFTGMNENISKNKSAYTVTGRVENKKLMVESFNYNYLGKDSTTGKSKKLYGTVRRSK